MGIDLCTTTLWAELATWQPHALEVIVRPEYWALRGASRMGKALTWKDRYDEHKPLPTKCIATGASAAREVVRLLSKSEPTLADWAEKAPPAARDPEEAHAVVEDARELVEKLAPAGLEQVLALAHAIQAGVKLPDDAPGLLAAAATPPSAPQRPDGPMSALLAASLDTIWLPRPMRFAWDGPTGSVASREQLRADLAALPAILRADAPPSTALAPAWSVVRAFADALDAAGDERCLSIAG